MAVILNWYAKEEVFIIVDQLILNQENQSDILVVLM